MIQLTTIEAIQKAVEKARSSNLYVQIIQWRQYRVTNREKGIQYTVDFFVRRGKRYGHCTCKAGMANKACKHLAAAAGLHLMVATARHTGDNAKLAA